MSKQTYDNYFRDYYKKNKERLLEYRKKRRKMGQDLGYKRQLQRTYDSRIKTMISMAKIRSKKDDLHFNIEYQDIIIPEICPLLGIRLDPSARDYIHSPSIDRIKPELGYVKGNIRIISSKANRMKSDITLDFAKKLVEYLS